MALAVPLGLVVQACGGSGGTPTHAGSGGAPTHGTIAFLRGDNQVAVMKPDGSGLRTLARGQDVSDPRWSPNGAKLAFTMYPRGGRRLYVVNADGSGLRRVSGPKDEEYDGAAQGRSDGQ